MQTQALPAGHLGTRGWRRPARNLAFRRLLTRAWRGDRPAQPVLLRRARLIALGVGGFLLPWCVVLTAVLPATAQAEHWALAWTGLDGAEAAAALMTAALLSRGDRRASLSAAAGGTLLLIDAWFDVCTSAPGTDHALALSEAACVEIPLAIAAWWLAIVLPRETR